MHHTLDDFYFEKTVTFYLNGLCLGDEEWISNTRDVSLSK